MYLSISLIYAKVKIHVFPKGLNPEYVHERTSVVLFLIKFKTAVFRIVFFLCDEELLSRFMTVISGCKLRNWK